MKVARWITWKGRRLPIGEDGKILKANKTVKTQRIDRGSFENTSWHRLTATINDEEAGYINYKQNLKSKEISIDIVRVHDKYQRQGIATRLMKDLQVIAGNQDIYFGGLTDDGKKLVPKIATITKTVNRAGVDYHWGRVK